MSCKLKRNRQRLQSKRDPGRERVIDRGCLTGPSRPGIVDGNGVVVPSTCFRRGLVNELDLRLIDRRPETLERDWVVASAGLRHGLGTS